METITVIQKAFENDGNFSTVDYAQFKLSREKFEEIKRMRELVDNKDNPITSLRMKFNSDLDWFSEDTTEIPVEMVRVELYGSQDFSLVGYMEGEGEEVMTSDICFSDIEKAFEGEEGIIDLREE